MGEAKETPILFSPEMVRALLAGTKTQTRRIVRDPPAWWSETACLDGTVRPTGYTRIEPSVAGLFIWSIDPGRPEAARLSPYGVPGDRLWVRETLYQKVDGIERGWTYVADDVPITQPLGDPRVPSVLSWAHHKKGVVCPSIHMPRWASRISLGVTAVRVERVQVISEEDARAEGVEGVLSARINGTAYRTSYARLWDRINGKRAPWTSNPWVWVVSFTRIDP